MDAILEFFTGVADLLMGAIDFLVGVIGDIVYIAQLTAKAVTSIPNFFQWLPAPVVALVVTIFAVVVIYKILGREG